MTAERVSGDFSEMMTLLDAALADTDEPDLFTTAEYMAAAAVTDVTARAHIRKLIELGEATGGHKKTVDTITGQRIKVWAYKRVR